ncbi:DoxX family membrane protein [bacterium]|nr:DoxX family membrane protein [bacterium]
MRPYLVLLLRLLIGGSFILSGITKIFQLTEFMDVVARFNILPPVLIIPFTALFPPVELVLGVCLVAGYLTRWSALGISFLLMIMCVAIFPQLLGGPKISDCGCFGGLMDSAVDLNLFIRDCVLFAISFFIFTNKKHFFTSDNYLLEKTQGA